MRATLLSKSYRSSQSCCLRVWVVGIRSRGTDIVSSWTGISGRIGLQLRCRVAVWRPPQWAPWQPEVAPIGRPDRKRGQAARAVGTTRSVWALRAWQCRHTVLAAEGCKRPRSGHGPRRSRGTSLPGAQGRHPEPVCCLGTMCGGQWSPGTLCLAASLPGAQGRHPEPVWARLRPGALQAPLCRHRGRLGVAPVGRLGSRAAKTTQRGGRHTATLQRSCRPLCPETHPLHTLVDINRSSNSGKNNVRIHGCRSLRNP